MSVGLVVSLLIILLSPRAGLASSVGGYYPAPIEWKASAASGPFECPLACVPRNARPRLRLPCAVNIHVAPWWRMHRHLGPGARAVAVLQIPSEPHRKPLRHGPAHHLEGPKQARTARQFQPQAFVFKRSFAHSYGAGQSRSSTNLPEGGRWLDCKMDRQLAPSRWI